MRHRDCEQTIAGHSWVGIGWSSTHCLHGAAAAITYIIWQCLIHPNQTMMTDQSTLCIASMNELYSPFCILTQKRRLSESGRLTQLVKCVTATRCVHRQTRTGLIKKSFGFVLVRTNYLYSAVFCELARINLRLLAAPPPPLWVVGESTCVSIKTAMNVIWTLNSIRPKNIWVKWVQIAEKGDSISISNSCWIRVLTWL